MVINDKQMEAINRFMVKTFIHSSWTFHNDEMVMYVEGIVKGEFKKSVVFFRFDKALGTVEKCRMMFESFLFPDGTEISDGKVSK